MPSAYFSRMKNSDTIRSQMYSYLEKWRATDLDMKTFCKQHNISYYSFKHWKYRQRDEKLAKGIGPGENRNNEEKGKFLPMQIEAPQTIPGYVISFPNGVQLNCPSNMEVDDLSKLIKSF